MIDIAQWRAAIGKFIHATCRGLNTATDYIKVLCEHFHKQHTTVQDATEVLHECKIKLRSDFNSFIVCCFLLHCFISVILLYLLVTYIRSPLAVAFLLFCGSPFNLPFTLIEENLIIIVIYMQLMLSGDIESNPGPNVYKDCPICNKPVYIRCKSCSSCGFSFKKHVRGVSNTCNRPATSGHSVDTSTNTPGTTAAASSSILASQVSTCNVAQNINCSAPVQIGVDSNTNWFRESTLSQPSSTKAAQKWAKCKDKTNAKRRFIYHQNPESKQKNSLKSYYLHPSPVRKRALGAYHSNPSPVKR